MGSTLTASNLAVATTLFVGFVGGLFILRAVVPGPVREGQTLRDGTRRAYKLNGLYLFLILAALLALGQAVHLFTLSAVVRLFWPLFVVANAFCVALTGYLYLTGVRKGGAQAGRVSGLWFGVELNPELWGVDLKMFAYVPSLCGLWVMNVAFGVAQWETLGHLTTRMWLYQAFFTIYIFNYFQFEYGMLHTWDVIAENFGFMLVWGDYAFVPFFYSICGWYLVGYTEPLQAGWTFALPLMFALGLFIFRGANEQKHTYKENPGATIWGKPAETVGGRLLVSGFWGIGRKLNYTGELMVYLSWTLTTGFLSVVPFILPLWLAVLFSHRAWRDDQRCRAKYGPLWEEYCRRATFRMIPFIY